MYFFLTIKLYLISVILADQNTKDRSTQYDREMEMRCKDLLENKVNQKNEYYHFEIFLFLEC